MSRLRTREELAAAFDAALEIEGGDREAALESIYRLALLDVGLAARRPRIVSQSEITKRRKANRVTALRARWGFVVEAAAAFRGVTVDDVLARRPFGDGRLALQDAVWALRFGALLSWQEIGDVCDGRDHTTAMAAAASAQARVDREPGLQERLLGLAVRPAGEKAAVAG